MKAGSPKVSVVIVEPLPSENFEALKSLIKRVALRKFKELGGKVE